MKIPIPTELFDDIIDILEDPRIDNFENVIEVRRKLVAIKKECFCKMTITESMGEVKIWREGER